MPARSLARGFATAWAPSAVHSATTCSPARACVWAEGRGFRSVAPSADARASPLCETKAGQCILPLSLLLSSVPSAIARLM
eukprot:6072201-Pleurochrysis_carterae.AAC.2